MRRVTLALGALLSVLVLAACDDAGTGGSGEAEAPEEGGAMTTPPATPPAQ